MKTVDKKIIEDKKLSQPEVILLHLLYNGMITNKDCNECYGYRHLPSIIRDLKNDYGVTFNTIKQKGISRFKQKTEYVEYHIKNPQIYKEVLC